MNKINQNRLNNTHLNNRIYSNNVQNIQNSRKSFEQVLSQINDNKNEVKFSKHAKERLSSRNIHLNQEEFNKLENAISKAEDKGIKEALILMGNTAFIASVKSKTIITTANSEKMQEKIFTNIDGAVII